jgi:hypothetical protein
VEKTTDNREDGMNFRQLLEKWGLAGLKINVGFLEAEWEPQDADKNAAWELYIELLTRIATQPLDPADGDEKTALDSIHALFALTREILKRNGKYSTRFARLAIPILNQIVRPFTARWHRLSLQGAFIDRERRDLFRAELEAIRKELVVYAKALADIAGVEDLTSLECK